MNYKEVHYVFLRYKKRSVKSVTLYVVELLIMYHLSIVELP